MAAGEGVEVVECASHGSLDGLPDSFTHERRHSHKTCRVYTGVETPWAVPLGTNDDTLNKPRRFIHMRGDPVGQRGRRHRDLSGRTQCAAAPLQRRRPRHARVY